MIFVENVLLEFWNVHKNVYQNHLLFPVQMIKVLLKSIQNMSNKVFCWIKYLYNLKISFFLFYTFCFIETFLHHFDILIFLLIFDIHDGVKGEVDEWKPVYMTNNSRQNQLHKCYSSEHSTIIVFSFRFCFHPHSLYFSQVLRWWMIKDISWSNFNTCNIFIG